jgi:hypothetical protein
MALSKVEREEQFLPIGAYGIEISDCLGTHSNTGNTQIAIKKWADEQQTAHQLWHSENDEINRRFNKPTWETCRRTVSPVREVLRGQDSGQVKWV